MEKQETYQSLGYQDQKEGQLGYQQIQQLLNGTTEEAKQIQEVYSSMVNAYVRTGMSETAAKRAIGLQLGTMYVVGGIAGIAAGSAVDDGIAPRTTSGKSTFSLAPEDSARVINVPKGQRPEATDYLPEEYVNEHLSLFANGASRFMSEENYQRYGIAQRDGTTFVMPRDQADALLFNTKGNTNSLELSLGLDAGLLDTNNLLRIDIPKPAEFNLRIPSGNEAGANSHWIPGGKLPNGDSEAIINGRDVPSSDYQVNPVNVGGK